MAEYIEREKYVKLNDIIETLEYEWGYEGIREDLYNLPTADVVEVRHGEWIPTRDNDMKTCSRCAVTHLIGQYPFGNANYCPNCGADMRGKKDE